MILKMIEEPEEFAIEDEEIMDVDESMEIEDVDDI